MNERTPSDHGCKEYAELISAYFDHQLSDAQAKAVEAHLAVCPACARRLKDYTLFHSLMNAEQQESTVDLNSTVMAGVEREELLSGLDLMTKPPTPRWVKVLRALSAAAMIGIIVGTVWLVMQFNETSHKKAIPAANEPILAMKTNEPSIPAAPLQPQTVLQDRSPIRTQAKSIPQKNNAPISAGSVLGSASAPPAPDQRETSIAPKEMALASAPSMCDQPPIKAAGTDKPLSATREVVLPNQPLVLLPSEKEIEPLATQPLEKKLEATVESVKNEPQTAIADAWPIPTVYRLSATDMPSWMLLKEQILTLLDECGLTALQDHGSVGESLASGREFFYVARKGLDLPPGPLRSRILLVVSPKKFLQIYNVLQFSLSDTVGQTLPPELKSLIREGKPTAHLAEIVSKSNLILREAFPDLTTGPTLSDENENATATKPNPDASPATAAASRPASKIVAPKTDTQPAEPLNRLPILIDIEIRSKSPATQPESMPATQPATAPTDFRF
jgi:hypothetical protein